MTIQRYTLEERWVSSIGAATGVALKVSNGKYVLFIDHEREIAKRDALLRERRDTCLCQFPSARKRCNLCKRTDALLEGK